MSRHCVQKSFPPLGVAKRGGDRRRPSSSVCVCMCVTDSSSCEKKKQEGALGLSIEFIIDEGKHKMAIAQSLFKAFATTFPRATLQILTRDI